MESLEDLRRKNEEAVSEWLHKRDKIIVLEALGDIANDYLPMIGGIMFVIDRKGLITYCNRHFSDMVGEDYRYVKGRSFSEFLHPEDLERTLQTYAVREDAVREGVFCNRYVCPESESGWQWIAWPANSDEVREQFVAIGYKIDGPDDPVIERLNRYTRIHWGID